MNRQASFAALVLCGLGVAVWALFFRGSSWPITNDPPTAGTTIVAFGDSLTEGVGAEGGKNYVDVLSELIGRPIINAGVRGNTAGEAFARLEGEVLGADPRVVIVCLGGNDVLRRSPPEIPRAALDEIIRRIQERGALVVLVGVEGIGLFGHQDYAPMYQQLARDRGCVYISDVLVPILKDARLKADPIHPNADGYRIMAQRIHDEAGAYLTK